MHIREMKRNEKTLYRLQVGSIEMCDDLRALGLTEQKTKNLSVRKVPKRYFSDFVRGYFDGDGNVWFVVTKKCRKTPSLTLLTAFTSCSRDFLSFLLDGLNEHGIEGGSLYDSKGNYSRLQFGTRDSLKLYELMYNRGTSSGLQLVRKRVVFERFQAMKKEKGAVVV